MRCCPVGTLGKSRSGEHLISQLTLTASPQGFYTVGGIIYALKLRLLNERFPNFGSHEIFHLFVLAGSFCHFVVMYEFLPL